jgi:hypothetical protein
MNDNDPKPLANFYGGVSEDDPRIGVLYITLPEPVSNPAPPMTVDGASAVILSAKDGGAAADLKRAFEVVDDDGSGAAYRHVLDRVLQGEGVADAFREAFHLNWTVRGFRHRALLQDDAYLIRAFRRIFPRYAGEAMTLYRGERASEIEAGRLGPNWTPSLEVARRFASGLCTTYGGDGVLLTATAPAEAIITLPNHHSANWLREHEHIVDPTLLVDVREIERFPPYQAPSS